MPKIDDPDAAGVVDAEVVGAIPDAGRNLKRTATVPKRTA
jgi:hypothetical protein